jgi:hypothetical protein
VPFANSIVEFDVAFNHGRQLQPAELFKRPFSVELMGAEFDKPANTRYFTLRFPRMLKIHGDRSFKDTISFEELQQMAKRDSEVQEDSERKDTPAARPPTKRPLAETRGCLKRYHLYYPLLYTLQVGCIISL